MLYVGVQYERHTQRSKVAGQMMKLDPSRPDPLVWSVFDNRSTIAGVWGTPALYQDIAIFDTNAGDVLGIDRATGEVRWRFHLKRTWSSPVVVDGVLLIGDCAGDMYGYDVSDTHADPTRLWSMPVGGCFESTPAVWKGVLYFATGGAGCTRSASSSEHIHCGQNRPLTLLAAVVHSGWSEVRLHRAAPMRPARSAIDPMRWVHCAPVRHRRRLAWPEAQADRRRRIGQFAVSWHNRPCNTPTSGAFLTEFRRNLR
jgi:hypothetical protein